MKKNILITILTLLVFVTTNAYSQECAVEEYGPENKVFSNEEAMEKFEEQLDDGFLSNAEENVEKLANNLENVQFNPNDVLTSAEANDVIGGADIMSFYTGIALSIIPAINVFNNPDATDFDKATAALGWVPIIGPLLGFIDSLVPHVDIVKKHQDEANEQISKINHLTTYTDAVKEKKELNDIVNTAIDTIKNYRVNLENPVDQNLITYYKSNYNHHTKVAMLNTDKYFAKKMMDDYAVLSDLRSFLKKRVQGNNNNTVPSIISRETALKCSSNGNIDSFTQGGLIEDAPIIEHPSATEPTISISSPFNIGSVIGNSVAISAIIGADSINSIINGSRSSGVSLEPANVLADNAIKNFDFNQACINAIFHDYKTYFKEGSSNNGVDDLVKSHGNVRKHLAANIKLNQTNKFYVSKKHVTENVCSELQNKTQALVTNIEDHMTNVAKQDFFEDWNLDSKGRERNPACYVPYYDCGWTADDATVNTNMGRACVTCQSYSSTSNREKRKRARNCLAATRDFCGNNQLPEVFCGGTGSTTSQHLTIRNSCNNACLKQRYVCDTANYFPERDQALVQAKRKLSEMLAQEHQSCLTSFQNAHKDFAKAIKAHSDTVLSANNDNNALFDRLFSEIEIVILNQLAKDVLNSK